MTNQERALISALRPLGIQVGDLCEFKTTLQGAPVRGSRYIETPDGQEVNEEDFYGQEREFSHEACERRARARGRFSAVLRGHVSEVVFNDRKCTQYAIVRPENGQRARRRGLGELVLVGSVDPERDARIQGVFDAHPIAPAKARKPQGSRAKLPGMAIADLGQKMYDEAERMREEMYMDQFDGLDAEETASLRALLEESNEEASSQVEEDWQGYSVMSWEAEEPAEVLAPVLASLESLEEVVSEGTQDLSSLFALESLEEILPQEKPDLSWAKGIARSAQVARMLAEEELLQVREALLAEEEASQAPVAPSAPVNAPVLAQVIPLPVRQPSPSRFGRLLARAAGFAALLVPFVR